VANTALPAVGCENAMSPYVTGWVAK